MGMIEGANRVNRILEKSMPLIVPLGVAVGVMLSKVFIGLHPFIPWFFGTITLSGALKLKARELGRAASSPLPTLLFFFSAHIFLPLTVFLLSSLIFKNDSDTVSGYLLLYSVPTAVTGFVWTSIFRGDCALALTLILLDTILAPLVVPATVRLLLGTRVALDMTGMAVSLICMIVIPTMAGVAMNEISRGKIPALINPFLAPFSKGCLFLMVATNSAAVAPQIHPDNPRFWVISVVCIGFCVLSFACAKFTSLVGKLTYDKQISLFFASGLRNISAAMTLGIEFFPASAALPAVLGIMFQQSIAAFMGRLLFRKPAAAGTPMER